MTDIAPMSDPGLPPTSNRPTKGGTDPDLKRRRLLQGGLASAPVLMTLVSRPVLAQCQSPSGFVSGNASTAGNATRVICSGRKPDFWQQPQNFGSWVAPYFPTTVVGLHQATLFDAVFGGNAFPNQTLLDVLQNVGGPPNDIARFLVAALLNVAAGLAPVLTLRSLQHIWSEYSTTGGYTPTAGAHWDHDEIISYLLSTMPL